MPFEPISPVGNFTGAAPDSLAGPRRGPHEDYNIADIVTGRPPPQQKLPAGPSDLWGEPDQQGWTDPQGRDWLRPRQARGLADAPYAPREEESGWTTAAKVATPIAVGAGLLFAPVPTAIGLAGASLYAGYSDPEAMGAAFRTENTIGSLFSREDYGFDRTGGRWICRGRRGNCCDPQCQALERR